MATLAELTNSGAKPTRLRFPDRTSTFVTTFAAVIKELAEWLIRNKKLPFPPVIDCYNKHYVLNDAGVDRSGLPFAQSSLLSNGWSVNMDYSAGDFSKNALWLLEKAGENPDEYFFC